MDRFNLCSTISFAPSSFHKCQSCPAAPPHPTAHTPTMCVDKGHYRSSLVNLICCHMLLVIIRRVHGLLVNPYQAPETALGLPNQQLRIKFEWMQTLQSVPLWACRHLEKSACATSVCLHSWDATVPIVHEKCSYKMVTVTRKRSYHACRPYTPTTHCHSTAW